MYVSGHCPFVITTDVYSKPTDTHQYLDKRSCHPGHVKRGIPYGQALRLRRICDTEETLEKRLKELRGHFIKRGFKKNLVDLQFMKAKGNVRNKLLCQDIKGIKSNRDGIPLVMEFHPALLGVSRVIGSLWPILHASDDGKIFEEKPILSFKRLRNLKDVLVKLKRRINKESVVRMKRCGKSRCQICQYINEGNEFGSGEKTYVINSAFDWDSQGVIYIIKYLSIKYLHHALPRGIEVLTKLGC